MPVETKEIALVKNQVTKAVSAAELVKVTTDEEMLQAGELRKKIKTVGKMLSDKRLAITRPINESLKEIRDMFKPLEEDNERAETIVSNKMLAYQKQQDDKRKKIEAEALEKTKQAEKDLAKGVITEKKAEQIIQKAEVKLDSATVVKHSNDFHTRTVKKFRIVDVKCIPRDLMIPDEVAIRKQMMAGLVVEGVEYYEENTLV